MVWKIKVLLFLKYQYCVLRTTTVAVAKKVPPLIASKKVHSEHRPWLPSGRMIGLLNLLLADSQQHK